jgi:hypothetical protein
MAVKLENNTKFSNSYMHMYPGTMVVREILKFVYTTRKCTHILEILVK